jgi:hypothetical protein
LTFADGSFFWSVGPSLLFISRLRGITESVAREFWVFTGSTAIFFPPKVSVEFELFTIVCLSVTVIQPKKPIKKKAIRMVFKVLPGGVFTISKLIALSSSRCPIITLQKQKAGLPLFQGNPAIHFQDPWLSVTVLRQIWLYL